MITYTPKDWWKLIFAFHRSDSFRVLLPGMIAVAAYTGLVAWIENDYLHVSFKNSTLVHSLVGFVLSMMLIFRTNTAYERWWEGRKLWGSFVNNSRNLALKLNAFLPPDATAERDLFRTLIHNFIHASKEHLRQGVDRGGQSGRPPAGDEKVDHPSLASAEFSTLIRLVSSMALSTVNVSAVIQALCTSGNAMPSTTTAT